MATGDEVYELEGIEVQEVSLVDKPANRRRFLVVKRTGEVRSGENDPMATETKKDDKAAADAGSASAAAAKAMHKIPGPVKEAVARALTEASERLTSLLNSVKAAEATEEQMAAPLPKEIADEALAIVNLIRSIGEKYPSPKAAAASAAEAIGNHGEPKESGVTKADHEAVVKRLQDESRALATRVAELEADKERAAHATVKKQLVDAGKLPESLFAWADTQSADQLAAFGAAAPVIRSGRIETRKGAPDAGGTILTDEERAITKMLGVSPDQFTAARAAQIAKRAERGEA